MFKISAINIMNIGSFVKEFILDIFAGGILELCVGSAIHELHELKELKISYLIFSDAGKAILNFEL